MRITNRQKDLISKRIADKLVKNNKLKSVAKHPIFVTYKKALDRTDRAYKTYDKARDISHALFQDLAERIFGVKGEYLNVDSETGEVRVSRYNLQDAINDELHLIELSSLENVDDIINEVLKKFEIK